MPLAYNGKSKNIENPQHRRSSSSINFHTPINACTITNIQFSSHIPQKLKILNQYLTQHLQLNQKIISINNISHVRSNSSQNLNKKTFSKYNNFKISNFNNSVLRNSQGPFSIQIEKQRNKNILLSAQRSLKKFPERRVISSINYRNKKQPMNHNIQEKFAFPYPDTQLFRNKEIMKKFTTSTVLVKKDLSSSQRSLSAKKLRIKTSNVCPSQKPLITNNVNFQIGTQSILINSRD